jgi:hypothetical protein
VNGDDAHMDLYHYVVSQGMFCCLCLFLGLIVPRLAARSQTSIWCTLCGKISFASVTKNSLWSFHAGSLLSPSCCLLNIIGSEVTRGRIRQIATLVSRNTRHCCFPIKLAICRMSARVPSVRGSLRPWPLVPSTSYSITRCI